MKGTKMDFERLSHLHKRVGDQLKTAEGDQNAHTVETTEKHFLRFLRLGDMIPANYRYF